jgi:hypothetical protein
MGSVAWLIALMASIGLSILGAWIRAELIIWNDPLIKFLVARSAAKLPPQFRLAAQAEMLSWIDDIRSPTKKVFEAFHFYFRAATLRDAFNSGASPEKDLISISSGTDMNARLVSLTESLEECNALLRERGLVQSSHLISLAILELRMAVADRPTDEELKALRDLMVDDEEK